MSETSTLTRCPHCQTRFRVTAAQLEVAGGKVRCGHCMQIFNARDHAVETAPQAAEKPAPPPEPKAAPQPEPEPEPQPEPAPADDDDDELIFADNPDEDRTEKGYRAQDSQPEFSDSFLALDEDSSGHAFADEDEEQVEEVDESWAESMLSEDDNNAPAKPSEAPTEEPITAIQPRPAAKPQRPPEKTAAEPDDTLRVEPDERPAPEKPQPEKPKAKVNPYAGLKPEPIGATKTGVAKRFFKGLLWLVVIAGLIAFAVYQVGWQQFDRLARVPELRPYYEKACDLAGCKLPPLIDVSKIESRKLVVRSDPQDTRALIVEAVLVNEASFSQPFPSIALTFANLNNDVVAQRVFQPDEYLAGEASDWTELPPDTPVRIALSIKDPGRDAVNYNMKFYPAQAVSEQ
ncbi:DUF3426 domain-containing protein [Marinobacteraceae bacterium S3BR75-40.1]